MQRILSYFTAMLMVVTMIPTVPVQTQASSQSTSGLEAEIDDLEKEAQQLRNETAALEKKLSANTKEIEVLVEQKNVIDQQVQLLHEQILNTNTQILTYGELIADTAQKLEQAQEDLTKLQEKHSKRIRAIEEQGELRYWSVLFEAKSFAEFLDNLNMIEEISEADNKRLAQLHDAAILVEEMKQTLEREKAQLQTTKEQLMADEAALQHKRQQADAVLRELVSKGAEYEMLLEESEKKQEALMQQLAQKESEYESIMKPPSGGAASGSGEWLTPVPYYTLSSSFGMRYHPILHIWRMHNGVDMGCAAETPIYASRSGVVTVASYQANGAGNYVQLDHGDGYRSIYMHMTRYIVKPGQQVTAGQTIGYVGSTGLSKGNHLHFGISYNGTYVNPMEYIG